MKQVIHSRVFVFQINWYEPNTLTGNCYESLRFFLDRFPWVVEVTTVCPQDLDVRVVLVCMNPSPFRGSLLVYDNPFLLLTMYR